MDKTLRKWFGRLGSNIGRIPGYYLIVPILCTALLTTGYQQMNYSYDPEYLFSPRDGEAKRERATLEEYFPMNFSEFKASRMTKPGKFGRVIVEAKDGGSLLRSHLWTQMLYLDQVLVHFTKNRSLGKSQTFLGDLQRDSGSRGQTTPI